MKCKHCNEKEIPAYNLKNKYYTCVPCHYKRNKVSIDASNKNYMETKMPKGVYVIKEGDTVIYVGESGRMRGRFGHHFTSQGSEKNAKWVSAVNQYIREKGRENFTFEVIEVIPDKETRLEVEQYYISLYNPIFNTYGRRKQEK